MTPRIFAALGIAVLLSACSTTQSVVLAKAKPTTQISSIARSTGDSNADDMNKNVEDAFAANGISVKPVLAPGMRTSSDVDAIVTYSDQWRWDMIMYLKGLNISMFDARSGDLLISSQWSDSALHGFRDSREVVRALVADMLARLKTATNTSPSSPAAAVEGDKAVSQVAAAPASSK